MEELHKRILATKRQEIIDNIASPLDVADALYASDVLTVNHVEDIKAENVRHRQVRALLDILPLRGPTAFDLFYDALVKTNNGSAADLLKPGLQRTELPLSWPDGDEMNKPVTVRLCDIKSHHITKYWKSPDVYSIKQRIRGRCVVISNENFEDRRYPRRYGAEADVIKLNQLFEQLNFEVIVFKDLSSNEIYERLTEESNCPTHKDADCFVLVLCSYGDEKGLIGTDSKTVELNSILALFNAQNCINLAFKPKLVFLQAAQGLLIDECVTRLQQEDTECLESLPSRNENRKVTPSTAVLGGCITDLSNIKQGKGGGIEDTIHGSLTAQEEILSIPSTADFLIVRSSQPGYMSFRNCEYGSWFIQAVVWVFQRYAYDREIHQLLILVNRLVAKGGTDGFKMSNKKQMPRFDSSLQKMFFFFPGVFATETPIEK